jgi:hypothetical protein
VKHGALVHGSTKLCELWHIVSWSFALWSTSYLEELSVGIARLQDREGRCLQRMCSW